ncbi:polysaccharide deacetylase family protein [Clostridium sp. AL.422]|uniref:polysaccharide deacetylase family protein n=1 Tax=Clostridium TaxID=1485 RepID=UPI00293DF379|nr:MULTISPECIES: polysaccharide deacetylase family protein [unclassified Clostridium]MDV4149889.1 polysaccharide deacetylase family protein [Clostridium sp. AL.422]
MKRKVVPIIIIIFFIILAICFYAYRSNVEYSSSEVVDLIKNDKYDSSYEINKAIEKYDINKKAKVIKDVDANSNIIALTFDGIKNKEVTEEILDLLDLYDAKATFFITGIEAAEDSSIVEMIKDDGHDIGSGSLSGRNDMQNLPKEEIISDLTSANMVIREITKNNTRLLKCSSTVYSNELLASAYAVGNKYVISPDHYLSYQSFKDYEQVNMYTKKLSKGDIISIKLDGVLDDFEYNKSKIEEKPAIDKQSGIDETAIDDYGYEVTIVDIVEWLLESITEKGITAVPVKKLPIIDKRIDTKDDKEVIENNITYVINNIYTVGNREEENNEGEKEEEDDNEENEEFDFSELINNNKKKLSPIVSRIFTTQDSLTYSFRGLSNEKVLNKVLESLKKYNSKGTFFVTKQEIKDYPDRIEKIIKGGHEIANGGVTTSSKILDKSTDEICKEIYEVDKLLKEKGISTNAYMAGYGYSNPNIQEAVSTIKQINGLGGYELITYTKAPILEKYRGMDAIEIVSDYFDINSYLSLSKGEIVYFRLDSDIFNNENVVSNIIERLTENYVKNGYAYKYNEETGNYDLGQIPLNYNIVPIQNIQNTIEGKGGYGRYSFISDFQRLEKVSNDKVSDLIRSNYIGNKNVPLYGFSDDEMLGIDTSGTIDTNGENVIFFTFDDWGGDPIVNGILDVLDKHGVKASFFTIAKYFDVDSGVSNINPNLLRTIALKGHDIGSHSYSHEILSTNKEKLEWSLIESYNSMAKVIGDLDSLKQYFRPPTLYVDKPGLSSVFEVGYKYSISGNISTHDYEKGSSDEIVKTIEAQLVEGVGNVIIMHMNNNSYYTAEALDKFLINNENGVYEEKYKIAKLSDYLLKK